jgi:hypothetical protein
MDVALKINAYGSGGAAFAGPFPRQTPALSFFKSVMFA